MDLQFGDIQEIALVTLAIRASETTRPNPRIRDEKAKEIIDTLGVDVSKYDPFLSHEGVVARTIMFADALRGLITRHPEAWWHYRRTILVPWTSLTSRRDATSSAFCQVMPPPGRMMRRLPA